LAEIVLPCLTTIADPLTFSTTAIMEEVSAEMASPVIDNKKRIVARPRNKFLKLLWFILDALQGFLSFVYFAAKIKPQYLIEGVQIISVS
jgi:hypothetical protein